MQTVNTRFEAELRKLIEAKIDHHKEVISNPVSSSSDVPSAYSEYRRQVGNIEGLNAALDLCEQANTILAQR